MDTIKENTQLHSNWKIILEFYKSVEVFYNVLEQIESNDYPTESKNKLLQQVDQGIKSMNEFISIMKRHAKSMWIKEEKTKNELLQLLLPLSDLKIVNGNDKHNIYIHKLQEFQKEFIALIEEFQISLDEYNFYVHAESKCNTIKEFNEYEKIEDSKFDMYIQKNIITKIDYLAHTLMDLVSEDSMKD